MSDTLDSFVTFAEELARKSGDLIMGHYRNLLQGSGPEVLRKEDTSPVTAADRGAEALMRDMIELRYPEHQVVGEEAGASGESGARYQWVLDPIDGTKPFIHGVPLFGTLIALLEEGEPLVGVIHLTAVGELMIGARGRPTTLNGRPVQVRKTAILKEATVLYTDAANMRAVKQGVPMDRLSERAGLVRGWGDCFGHFMVAAGRADVMIDPQLSLWDLAALKPCVVGAGGRFTDIGGKSAGLGQSAVSSNGLLHDEVLSIFNG